MHPPSLPPTSEASWRRLAHVRGANRGVSTRAKGGRAALLAALCLTATATLAGASLSAQATTAAPVPVVLPGPATTISPDPTLTDGTSPSNPGPSGSTTQAAGASPPPSGTSSPTPGTPSASTSKPGSPSAAASPTTAGPSSTKSTGPTKPTKPTQSTKPAKTGKPGKSKPAPSPSQLPPSPAPAAPTVLPSTAPAPLPSVAPSPSATTPVGATGSPAGAALPTPKPDLKSPLELKIETLNPSVVTPGADITITGTITNTSKQTWTGINVHPFNGVTPMTTSSEIAAAAATRAVDYVGARITVPGTFATVPQLAPGASESFTVTVPDGSFPADSGVYWVGVHALGDSDQPRDDVADGRARTFIPRLPVGAAPVRAALVLPLRARIERTPDGRVARPAQWAKQLGPGGRLTNLLQAGLAAGDRPVSWLVDPALIQTVVDLSKGNPGINLAPLPGVAPPAPADAGTASPSADPSTASTLKRQMLSLRSQSDSPAQSAESGSPPATTSPHPQTPEDAAAMAAATAWLDLLSQTVPRQQPVLALPYGDVDVSSTVRYAPSLFDEAMARSAQLMQRVGLISLPTLAPASGYLDPAVLTAAPEGTVAVVSDSALDQQLLAELVPAPSQSAQRRGLGYDTGSKGSAIALAGHQVIASSAGIAAGGPGPEPAGSPIAVRQRMLSEAAVRMLSGSDSPLVIVPPPSWNPAESTSLFASLDAGVISMVRLDDLTSSATTELPDEALLYPSGQSRKELPQAAMTQAGKLLNEGGLLGSVLALPSGVAEQVGGMALTQVSEQMRSLPERGEPTTRELSAHVAAALRGIKVEGPPTATLTSGSGKIGVTLINTLDYGVQVQVAASTDQGMRMQSSEVITLAPDTRRRLLLNVATERSGVHRVVLQVLNPAGVQIGSYDAFTLRAAQFSRVIWWSLLGGFALIGGLFAWRVIRRIRVVRRVGRSRAS